MSRLHKGILKPDGSIELVDDPFVWAQWMDSPDKILRQDEAAGFFVSTIFLGVDLGYGKRAIWFETMVFRCQADDDQPAASRAVTQERYSTRHEALAGHQRILEAVRSGEIGE